MDAVERRVGAELKRFREASGLSLRTLAERAGFSASFISQVENGQASPSLASLERIANALGITLADLFATPISSEVMVVRAGERPSFRSDWSRARVESLAPRGRAESLDAMMVTLDSGGASGKRTVSLSADQLGVVLEGHLTLALSGDEILLEPGDSVLIRSRTPHRWQNDASSVARVLLVSPRRLI